MIPENITLPKSGVYTNPANDTDPLSLVYGDLTDGSTGIWVLPHIDTVNHVYAFAGDETLSVANGNVVTVYVDGVLASPQPTFDESDNYESQGIISTVTFASAQSGTVSARGKGKPTVASGSSLMTNPIDIIDDLMTGAGISQSDYNQTAKAKARQNAVSQGYIAAGVLTADGKAWDILQDILNTFNTPKSQAYTDGQGLLVLTIDTGLLGIDDSFNLIPKYNLKFSSGVQRLDDIVNSVNGAYRFNYVASQYYSDVLDITDSQSINSYGTQPASFTFPWCRNSGNVTTILNLTIEDFKNPLWFVSGMDITLGSLNLDIGALVVASVRDLFDLQGNELINEYWRIMSFNPGEDGIKLMLLDTGSFLKKSIVYGSANNYGDTGILYGGTRDLTEY